MFVDCARGRRLKVNFLLKTGACSRFVRHEQSSLDHVVGAAAAAPLLNAEVLELELCPESTAEQNFSKFGYLVEPLSHPNLALQHALRGNLENCCFMSMLQVRRRSLALQRRLPLLPIRKPQRPLSASPKRRARSWTAASWTCTASEGLLPSACLLRRQELVCKCTNVLGWLCTASAVPALKP